MNKDAGKDQGGFIFLGKPEAWAGINTASLINEIKTVINNNAVIISEGRAFVETAKDFPQKKKFGVIIKLLNLELQNSSMRLEELLTRFNSA